MRRNMDDWKQDRIRAAERGENPMTLTRMRSGFAVIGDDQFLPGYCLLLSSPRVDHLTDLPFAQRSVYLQDMGLIGEAIVQVCAPLRMNYEILGNYDHYLHAHIFPRYAWESDERREHPIWLYPKPAGGGPRSPYSEETQGTLRRQLTDTLLTLMRTHDALPE
jgi:diadenosine tetraphosphate (Ap4A) HIT family hydrolase